jgi:hypothetical protein
MDIATSTMMEAEYSVLVRLLKDDDIPSGVICYVIHCFDAIIQAITRLFTTVYEDKQGVLCLAQMEPGRQTLCSTFYAIKRHWFRSRLKPNEIELKYIKSAIQRADILTQSLNISTYEAYHIRNLNNAVIGIWTMQRGLIRQFFTHNTYALIGFV